MASGVIDDENGNKHRVVLPGLVIPGLGHHLFLASQAAKTGLATIIDFRSRLEQGQPTTETAGEESTYILL